MDQYVEFGDVAIKRLDMQCQYASRYADLKWKERGHVYLAEGLRIIGTAAYYHDMKIHKDDVEEFVRRVIEYRKSIGAI